MFCCPGVRGGEDALADNGGLITPAFKALVKHNKTSWRTSSSIWLALNERNFLPSKAQV